MYLPINYQSKHLRLKKNKINMTHDLIEYFLLIYSLLGILSFYKNQSNWTQSLIVETNFIFSLAKLKRLKKRIIK